MKYIKGLAVISLLIILPGASWYFLQSGLDWRRVKAKELVPKDDVTSILKNNDTAYNLLKGKTTLLKMDKTVSALDNQLIEQFKDAYTFQYVSSAQVEALTVPMDYNYILIDTSGDVRKVYNGVDTGTLTSIVEDIALVLPHRKPKDIKMKNKEIND